MLVVGQNAYFDIVEAGSLLAIEFYSTSPEIKVWNDLTDMDKTVLIIRSTRLVDSCLFRGYKAFKGSPLSFPRMINNRLIECPLDVKMAILLQGINEIIYNKTDEARLKKLGVKTYSVEGASITFESDTYSNKQPNGVFKDVFMEYLVNWSY